MAAYTEEQVREALNMLETVHGHLVVRAVLSEYAVRGISNICGGDHLKLSNVPKDRYPALMENIKRELDFQP